MSLIHLILVFDEICSSCVLPLDGSIPAIDFSQI